MGSLINKIESILKSEYSVDNYISFVTEVFDSFTIVAPNVMHKEVGSVAKSINGYCHVGNYFSPKGEKISIFSICLNGLSTLENTRSLQRNYAKKLIEAGNCDAAFIAFYTEKGVKWRISFVRLDYEMAFVNGSFKAQEKLTPAKRYSFLVGKDEPCNTAISRFYNFIINKNFNPSLNEIEETFSVESVTQEFYTLYCEKYYELQEHLEKNVDFVSESKRCNFTSEEFAKKLMGQIVFLYFLQKKGWLGVKVWSDSLTEDDYNYVLKSESGTRGQLIQKYLPFIYKKGVGGYLLDFNSLNNVPNNIELLIASHLPKRQSWGEGSNSFVRDSFEIAEKNNLSFYEYFIKNITYEALNKNRGEFSYCNALHCRIPYLAGGLFEPINNYDWKNTNFCIPNSFFSNKRGDRDYTADGVLDIFDRFNFTICEDEPMEKEVAVDPEMLGKVFENLLEVKDRKSMGAFYTPREIVDYMCKESLIHYLTNKTSIDKFSIKEFVVNGEYIEETDIEKISLGEYDKLSIPQDLFKLDSAGKVIVNRLFEIDDALEKVRILDPAVGSGAFLLDIVNEIVRLRQIITEYISIGMSNEQKELLVFNGRTTYYLKYKTIKDCIYGVDNSPSAVDIARLRLWLSLVIDDKEDADSVLTNIGEQSPRTLPNLDNTIVCSDSINDTVFNLDIFCKKGIISATPEDICKRYITTGMMPIIKRLIEEQEKLFICNDPIQKASIKNSVLSYKSAIIRKISSIRNDQEVYYIRQMNKRPCTFTLWQLDFAKVFVENGGFDIVIGDPPYVQLQKSISDNGIEKIGDKYSELGYKTYTKTGDLYCLFYELGISLLKRNGCLTYITSNKWMRTEYGRVLRSYFISNTQPHTLVDFSGTKVFETAAVDVCILLLERTKNIEPAIVCTIDEPCGEKIDEYVCKNATKHQFKDDEIWSVLYDIDEQIKNKILAIGTPLKKWKININYGVKTGLNKAYVIDNATKEKLCREDPKSKEILHPVLRGRDLKKWTCDYNNLWLIDVHNGIKASNTPPINIDNYKAIKNHLLAFYPELKARNDQGVTPFHLRNCAYYDSFYESKIIFQEMVQSSAFAFDKEGKYMCLDTARIITGEHLEYLTALFNSNLFFFAVKHYFGGGKLGGKGIRMKHTFFINFTAYEPTPEEELYIKRVVTSESGDKDKLINEFFYKKYNISKEEIDHIEADIK